MICEHQRDNFNDGRLLRPCFQVLHPCQIQSFSTLLFHHCSKCYYQFHFGNGGTSFRGRCCSMTLPISSILETSFLELSRASQRRRGSHHPMDQVAHPKSQKKRVQFLLTKLICVSRLRRMRRIGGCVVTSPASQAMYFRLER